MSTTISPGDGNGDPVSFTHPLIGTVSATFGDNAFATIHDALARVDSGGTIYVAAGNYAETSGAGQNLFITKPVSFSVSRPRMTHVRAMWTAPAMPAKTIIVPGVQEAGMGYDSTDLAVVNINSDGVSLDGF